MFLVCFINIDIPCAPSFAFELSAASHRLSSCLKSQRCLQIFLYVEDISERKLSSSQDKWEDKMKLLSELRDGFGHLIANHSRKFHHVIHSCLNKIICNYGAHLKVNSDCISDVYILPSNMLTC